MKKTERKAAVIPVKDLHPFEGNPYMVREGEEMDALTESIQERGVLAPLIVRPMADAALGYEVISGHRRLAACQRLDMESVPVIVQPMTDDEAAIAVVDANLQREHILPSEKAFAYKMKAEALNRQGKRTDLTSGQLVPKLDANRVAAEIGSDAGESYKTVQRYIRLTYLLPELLDLMDQGRVAFTPAVSLSYLKPEEQRWVLEEVEANACTPSVGQAYHLKEESQAGRLTQEMTAEMMAREKPNQREAVRVPWERLRGAVPEDYDAKRREEFIVKACEHYARYLRRQRDKDAR